MKNEIKKQINILLLSFIFILIFSNGTSPISKYYGSDSAFFMFFGKAMNHGYIPYKDLFDHKGPYLFLLEQISHFIYEGRLGTFVVQVINLSLCIFVINILLNKYKDNISNIKKILIFVLLGVYFAVTFRDGNSSEEYSLCFSLISLLLTTNYLLNIKDKKYCHKTIYAFAYGIFFGIIALSKITNSVFICSVVLTIVIILIINKEYKNLLFNAIAFISGLLLSVIPIFIYYYHYNALGTMLYSVFVFASKYATSVSLKSRVLSLLSIEKLVFVLPIFLPVYVLLLTKKTRSFDFLFSTISSVATFIATSLGDLHIHYLVLAIPNLVYGFCLLIKYEEDLLIYKKNYLIITTTLLIIIGQLYYFAYYTSKNILQIIDYSISEKKSHYYEDMYEEYKEVVCDIPGEERDDIWGYGIKGRFYYITDTYPAIKYFDYIDQHSKYLDTKQEIRELLFETMPKWLIVSKEKESLPDYLEELLINYSLNKETDNYLLYRINN